MHRRIPVLEGILPLDRKRVPIDVVAGITLAALAIPEVMGYTKIAGMPVITGLYTILLPITVFALLGSSRHLVVGADSATAAIMFAGLAGLAAPDSTEWVALAGWLAILAAGFLVLARILKLGFLADFLSSTVLIGFLTGVGVQVACGQIAGMLGVPKTGNGPIMQAFNAIKDIPQASGWTVVVSASVLIVIVGSKYISKKIPGALIAVIGAIAASALLRSRRPWASPRSGTIPSGLPHFGVPDAAALHRVVHPDRDRRLTVPGHPRPERGHIARVRRQVRRDVVQRERRPRGTRPVERRRRRSPARSSSTAAPPRPRWSTAPAAGVRCRR